MSLRRPILVLASLTACAAALAGDFGVSPLRVDLDRNTRTSVVRVTNDEKNPLSFQIRAVEWKQDAEGRDVYTDTSDLIYFPQQMQIPPTDSRVIRIGYRNPAAQVEQAYRLYVEEIPAKSPGREGQAVVDVAVRFGIPVFLRPQAVQERGEIRKLEVTGGKAAAQVENLGSVHFRINRVTLQALDGQGGKVFEQTLDGWYLLSGASRLYSAALPREACLKAAKLQAEVVAEKLNLRREIEVRPENCS